MFSSLSVENYRTFRMLTVDELTRVTLFVGANNAGKTTILDAVDLLALRESGEALWRASERRHESNVSDAGGDSGNWENSDFDARLIFHGRRPREGVALAITSGDAWVRCSVRRSTPGAHGGRNGHALDLEFQSDLTDADHSYALDPDYHVVNTLHRFRDPSGVTWHREILGQDERTVRFLGTHLDVLQQVDVDWERVVLTPAEDSVLDALRIIEPGVERLAYLGRTVPRSHARGFMVALKGGTERVPLGSLGDGMKRLLALSLNLASARGGYLLVDEIDTGLHHSAMVPMWRLVIETAKRLDVQVFATTHSLDCVHALAWLYERQPEVRDDVTLHRVERGGERTMRYTVDELLVAARERFEVR